MRTARARISGEKRFDFLFMAPSSQSLEPPQYPGRFSPFEGQRENWLLLKCRVKRHIDLKLLKKVVWPQVWGGGDFGAKPLSSLKALHLALVL